MDSATALRLLSPVSNVQGETDSLQNMDTTELPDGALCVVVGVGLYLLDKTSGAAEAVPTVVAPSSGPGRWTFVLADSPSVSITSAHSQLSITSSGSSVGTGAAQGVWTVFPTTPYDGDFDPSQWAFDDTTGVLTYLGPTRQFEITVYLEAAPGTAAAALIGLDIAVNEDLVGGGTRTPRTMEATTTAATTDRVSLATSRVATVATGWTIRAVAWNAAAAHDITALSMTLVVRPF